MKPCPVRIAHPAHWHPTIGFCPGITAGEIRRRVEAQKTDAFNLASNLSRRLGMVVSPQMVRRNMRLWERVWERLSAVSNDVE